ncbi:MAG: hypothetical protein ACE5SW_01450, partial [Nitrososphaeraceae archaeon]
MNFYLLLVPLISLLGFVLSIDAIPNISSQQIPDEHLLNKSVSVKITSHQDGEQVPIGKLTISGISNDDTERNCIIYVDWNNKKPFQQVRAAGPGGADDFSEWFFTYDEDYYTITEGDNDLTSKITCTDIVGPAGTKWYSVNLIGVSETILPNSNQETNISDSLDEPSHIIIPGFTSKFETPTLQNDVQNPTSKSVDEPSQKIIPGSTSDFENPTLQNDLQRQPGDSVKEFSQLEVPSEKHNTSDSEKTKNSLIESNISAIKNEDISLSNNTGEVKNKGNNSEIRMIDNEISRSTFFENSNQSNNTLSGLESLKNNSDTDSDVKSTTSEYLSVFVVLPEPVIINNDYSSELSVLTSDSSPVADAIISGEISNTVNPNYMITFLGKTDSNGTYNFPLKISNLFPTGEYDMKVIVTKLGLPDSTFSTNFFVSENFTSNKDLERSGLGNLTDGEELVLNKNISNTFSQLTKGIASDEDQMKSLNNSANFETPPFKSNEYPTLEQPPPTFEQPPPTFEQPPPTFEQPPPTFEQPPPTFEQPPP